MNIFQGGFLVLDNFGVFDRSVPLPTGFFFFNDTATTEIYTLSLHDALPILYTRHGASDFSRGKGGRLPGAGGRAYSRSEEHTSELQSRPHLVCRLLLEKKKKPQLPIQKHKKKKQKKLP